MAPVYKTSSRKIWVSVPTLIEYALLGYLGAWGLSTTLVIIGFIRSGSSRTNPEEYLLMGRRLSPLDL
ncbi:MAG: hypothetical protein CM1200mP10_02940 [Candidatus Neomarinimicrobiota bacterium]|nr:MAG: hypothetical protein CM1200mP10_02940 [Candidatus Neomarinimicrobiota bacterium]